MTIIVASVLCESDVNRMNLESGSYNFRPYFFLNIILKFRECQCTERFEKSLQLYPLKLANLRTKSSVRSKTQKYGILRDVDLKL